MTDEQLKKAPRSPAAERMVALHSAGALIEDKLTADIIAALQSDGQYIVFAAPEGYKFEQCAGMKPGDEFPSFSCIGQTVTPIRTGSDYDLDCLRLVRTGGGGE